MENEIKRAVIELTLKQWGAVKARAKLKGLTVTAYIRLMALEDSNV